jgi:hypothetical protein
VTLCASAEAARTQSVTPFLHNAARAQMSTTGGRDNGSDKSHAWRDNGLLDGR